MKRNGKLGAALAMALINGCATVSAPPSDAMTQPLAAPGDVQRGKRIMVDKNVGACVLCHEVPDAGLRFMGTVGPALAHVGSRYTEGQLRLRVVDYTRIKADAVMPAYYRTEGLAQVMQQYRGRTVLTAQQVEDVVAFLQTLK